MRDGFYSIKEIFYSLQGEGVRAGCPSVFVRFAGCNLACKMETHGFDCDTDFLNGEKVSLEQVVSRVKQLAGTCRWIVFTGGEPGLQLDIPLIAALREHGFSLAVETNGTQALPGNGFLDWITVSPKTPDSGVRQRNAHEVKFVVKHGDPIPRTGVDAQHYVLSPAALVKDKNDPMNAGHVPVQNLEWAVQLCLDNPPWRVSEQLHKRWRVR